MLRLARMPAKSTITWDSTKALSNQAWTKHTTSRRRLVTPNILTTCLSPLTATQRASKMLDPSLLPVLKVIEASYKIDRKHNQSPTWQRLPSTKPPSLLISRSKRTLRWEAPPRMPRAPKAIAKPATSPSSAGFSLRFSEGWCL